MGDRHRPDWAPTWWDHSDLHHTLGGALATLAPQEFDHPGTLAAGLRRCVIYLEASTARDAKAHPQDRGLGETDAPGDWSLEDSHHAWLDGDGWARKQLGLMARRLAYSLTVRRMGLRARFADRRPFTEAA